MCHRKNKENINLRFLTDPDHPDKVCLLKKAIYRLKQASCTWNQQFHGVLLGLGFTRTHSDAGVYHRQDDGGTLIIILYVDDITIVMRGLHVSA
jgi:hypothetical protein